MIDLKIQRAHFLVDTINRKINEKWITRGEIAKNMWVSQPAITPFLTMKRIWTDDFLKRIMEAIPLTETEIKKIFMEADKEDFRNKYWDLSVTSLIINNDGSEPETTKEEVEKLLFKMNWLKPTDDAIRSVRFAMDLIKKDQEEKNKK